MLSTATRSDVAHAIGRATAFFAERETRAGVLARRLLGTASTRDAVLADHLTRERRQRTRMDGSTDGSLVKSAWTALELLQLDCPPDHAGVVRTMGWVLARQSQPGRFGEECSDERHAQGLCQHFLSGFFSPGPTDVGVAPLSFPSGVTVHGEEEARFAASCFALRVVLRARQERRQTVLDHVRSLLNLGQVWSGWGGRWPPDLVLFALSGLAQAPLELQDRVEGLAAQVARRQRADGSWAGADLIHAVDVMLTLPTAHAAVRAAVPQICRLSHDGEIFEDPEAEERSLIALRGLKAAAA